MTGSPAGSADGFALVHGFDADHGDLTAEERRSLLGGKGAALAAMTAMGLPVPAGATLTTAACRRFLAGGWDDELEAALRRSTDHVEAATGRRLGDPGAPLLVSVRAGAPASMPGMLATVLDVGLTDVVAEGMVAAGERRAFVEDTRARARRSWEDAVGAPMPGHPLDQVRAAVIAAFGSWNADRVVRYRDVEGIPSTTGTAVTVQAMVFGNRDAASGSGVAFTRDPSTGEPGLMGDVLVGAQGDEVVSGGRATLALRDLRERWPGVWAELDEAARRLEHHFADLVDIEFTVESGRLWLLQARVAKRSQRAALRVAVDLAEDPTFPLDRAGAVARCRSVLDAGDDAWADPDAGGESSAPPIVAGVPAAPGRAIGVLCLDGTRAEELCAAGTDVVLVRPETSPADVPAMASAVGLVTALGGAVSHAAVIARDWGIPAVVGASELRFVDGGVEGPGGVVAEGEVVTVDGDAGRLLRGAHPGPALGVPAELAILRRWSAGDAGDA